MLSVASLAMLLGLAAPGAAQQPKPDDLDALLHRLVAAPAAAWDARAAAVQAAAKQAREEEKALRDAAAADVAKAEQRELAAERLAAEIAKLKQVRAVLGELTFRDPAGGGDAAATDRGRLEQALATLANLPAAAWDARIGAVEVAAKTERDGAKALGESAKQREAQAKAKAAAATALDEEVKTLAALRKLLGELDVRAAEPAAAQAEPAMAPPAAPTKAEKKTGAEPSADDERLVTFDEHVFPIFDFNCTTCHDPTDASGGLDLTTYAAALQGGGSGRTLVPGDPSGSRLYQLVSHQEKPTMPPDEPRMEAATIETIRLWIEQGAPKDAAAAKLLAAQRAAERAKADAEPAAGSAGDGESAVVLPESWPAVDKRYPARPGALRAIAASPVAPLIAVPGFGQVLLLHTDGLRELAVADFPFGEVERLSFSMAGTRLLAAGGQAGRSGGAVVFDVRTGAEVGRSAERPDALLAAHLSPDGRLMALGGVRRRVEVVRVDDGTVVWQANHDDWVMAVAFSPDGKLLGTADRAGNVLVREAASGREVHSLRAAEGAVTALAFAPRSDVLATAGADRRVRVFRMSDARQLWSQRVHADDVLGLAWRSRTHLLSCGADGRILHWKSDGKRERDLPRAGEWLYGIAVAADGSCAFAGDWSGRLLAFDLETRKLTAELMPLDPER